jgi:two-component system alkaline phosphatase synthesis response regulator PhoP
VERILVVEDDGAVQKALRRLFEAEAYQIEIAADGIAGLNAFRDSRPSLVILDLRLPGMSGREVCREMKVQAPSVPVMMLSAATEVSEKVLLLELGADDYVTKPFSPRELLARARVIMRRSAQPPVPRVFTFGVVRVEFARMLVTREGQPVALTPQEFRLLEYFIQNSRRVISREELLTSVWNEHNSSGTRTIDNHVLRLRQKLEEDPAFPIHIRTVHAVGYKFVP